MRQQCSSLLSDITRQAEQLFQAIFSGNIDWVRALVAEGVHVGAVDKHGATALHQAAASQSYEILRLLI